MNALSAEVRPLERFRAKRATSKLYASHASFSVDTLEGLRLSAMLAEANAATDIDLANLWGELVAGTCRILDGFFTKDRHYLILSNASCPPMAGRRLAIVEAVLSGTRQKSIAIDMDLAPSTVALNARLALQSLGVNGKPSRAHPLLMLAARASRDSITAVVRRSTVAARDGSALTVVSATRPDHFLGSTLPLAELDVIRSLVEGNSYAEIARSRGTSTRTIANQITAVFRRLKLSGRNELVQRLFLEKRVSIIAPRERAETGATPGLGGPQADNGLSRSRRSA